MSLSQFDLIVERLSDQIDNLSKVCVGLLIIGAFVVSLISFLSKSFKPMLKISLFLGTLMLPIWFIAYHFIYLSEIYHFTGSEFTYLAFEFSIVTSIWVIIWLVLGYWVTNWAANRKEIRENSECDLREEEEVEKKNSEFKDKEENFIGNEPVNKEINENN